MESLSQQIAEKQTKLFNETGAFFAFNTDHFNKKKESGVEYVRLSNGLFCHKGAEKTLIDGLTFILENGIKEDVERYGAKAIIRREYFNYETQIENNNTDVIESLETYKVLFPDEFSDVIIENVCKECFKEAVEKDWF